jgi:hypothetical protein
MANPSDGAAVDDRAEYDDLPWCSREKLAMTSSAAWTARSRSGLRRQTSRRLLRGWHVDRDLSHRPG